MIHIAICDDEKRVLDEIGNKVSGAFAGINCMVDITKFSNPFELMEHIRVNSVDVLFLDIDMPSLSGMDVAQVLMDNEIKTLLVFVTSHDALVYQSFKYHPFGFIRKSYFDEEISSVVQSAVTELNKRNECFAFKTSDGIFKVLFSDILYFESESNYVILFCREKQYRFRSTISSVEKELASKGFIRIHKGFLVNQQHIFAIKGDEIELSNKKLLPIGRTNRDIVKKTILRYIR